MTLPAMPSLPRDIDPRTREALNWMWGEITKFVNQGAFINTRIPSFTITTPNIVEFDPGGPGLVYLSPQVNTTIHGIKPYPGILTLFHIGAAGVLVTFNDWGASTHPDASRRLVNKLRANQQIATAYAPATVPHCITYLYTTEAGPWWMQLI